MDLFTLAIVLIGVGLGFYVQTVAGFAASLVALPIILIVLPVQEAVALMSLFFLVFSIILIIRNRTIISTRTVLELAIGAVLGLIVGTVILAYSNPLVLKRALGVFILLYVAHSLAQKRTIAIPSMFGPVFGFIGGVFSGLFSTGGPLYVAYIHNRLSGSDVIRATIIATMGITDVLRVPLLAMSGIITYHTLVVFLYALPVFLLALLIGHGTYRSINEHTFRTIVLVLLSISGITLLIG